ncbi:MAG: DUF86 domain-containing protein [Anaerolineae bacterium]|nr:DUF86 domain-containing protein [Anaerolineales bacterium]MCQ3973788.1 DUF86 domain-containing protein [Anaerolineae bacterium]
MSRDYKLYLADILEAIRKIESYTQGLSLLEFNQDEMRVDAVMRNLEIIGEATKNIPAEVRQKYPAVEWRKIAGLRDVAIHTYFTIDLQIIWDVVQNKLPNLHSDIAKILEVER